MNKQETLFDPKRTIDAGRLNDTVHIIILVNHKIKTVCGFDIDRSNILILRQREEDISCEDCKKLLTTLL